MPRRPRRAWPRRGPGRRRRSAPRRAAAISWRRRPNSRRTSRSVRRRASSRSSPGSSACTTVPPRSRCDRQPRPEGARAVHGFRRRRGRLRARPARVPGRGDPLARRRRAVRVSISARHGQAHTGLARARPSRRRSRAARGNAGRARARSSRCRAWQGAPRRSRCRDEPQTWWRRDRHFTGSTTSRRCPRSPACCGRRDGSPSCGTRATTAIRGWPASPRSSATRPSRSPTWCPFSRGAACSGPSRRLGLRSRNARPRGPRRPRPVAKLLREARARRARTDPGRRRAAVRRDGRARRRAARLPHGLLPHRTANRLTGRCDRPRMRALQGSWRDRKLRASGFPILRRISRTRGGLPRCCCRPGRGRRRRSSGRPRPSCTARAPGRAVVPAARVETGAVERVDLIAGVRDERDVHGAARRRLAARDDEVRELHAVLSRSQIGGMPSGSSAAL